MTPPQHLAETAAVMVTHDGERFLPRQLQSIFDQTQLPAVLIVVDDASRDGSRGILGDMARVAPIPVELVFTDGSGASDANTRVARNIVTGLAAVARYDLVVLTDQDDVWLADRVASQQARFVQHPGVLLVAGDGLLIDETDQAIGGSLRDRFPLPPNWATLDAAGRMRAAIRQPLVTGAATTVSREMVGLMTPIPRGWLHDRWATLVAAARDGLVLQPEPVINYRLHAGQLVGDRQAATGRGGRRWRQVLSRGSSPREALAHARDIVDRVRPLAGDPAVRAELTWTSLLRSGLERV